jgi:ankyrin repeat protein
VNPKNYFGGTSLHGAGTKEVTELLIAAGADVNAKGLLGMTPLHDAAQNSPKEIVELLIANGADVNAKADDGKTPLDLAIKRNPETANLLRKHGDKTGEELKAEGK